IFTAGPHGPVGASASAYQTSPNTDGFPNASKNTDTHLFRNEFHAIDPLCGFISLPSTDLTICFAVSGSQLDGSCQSSNSPRHFRVGNGLPKRTQKFDWSSFQ